MEKKTLEKGALGRPRRRYKYNTKIYLKEIGWDFVDRINLAQDKDKKRAVVRSVINLRIS